MGDLLVLVCCGTLIYAIYEVMISNHNDKDDRGT